ncbi:MAG: hypothetical protein VX286_04110 [Bacteroidota bacterium]|nr:hypothetical protein [Bacteroidota bacterium]
MYITQANIHACRKEITKAWGRSVQTQRDCVALAEAIFEKTNKKVASHTLRRFFGLVAFDGQFRKSTLDTLANYAGYASCDDFLDRLKQEEDLVELLVRLQVQNVEIDEYYINRLIERDISMEAVMMAGHLINMRLEQNDQERIIRLFQALEPVSRERHRYHAIVSVFAHYVGPKFHALEDEGFMVRLMKETPLIDLVLAFYVPVMELDAGYGRLIEMMLGTSDDSEHQAFGHSLLATRALLENQREQAHKQFNAIPAGTYFPILAGRIAVLDYLLNDVSEAEIPNRFAPPANEEIFCLKAITPLLVAFDRVDLLERFIDEHKLLSITAQHWMEESVKKQTELAMAWILAKRGKIAESKATLGVLKDTTFPRDYQGTSRLIIEATEALLQP